jgi:hypothetical protein
MTIEQLRAAREATPFKPFAIRLADGQAIDVPHPEFLLVTPIASRTFVVALSAESYRVIDLLLVTSLDFGVHRPRNGTARRRRRRR